MLFKKHLYPMLAAAIAAPAAALADPAYALSFLPDGFYGNVLGENGLVAGSIHTGDNPGGAIYSNGNVTRYSGRSSAAHAMA